MNSLQGLFPRQSPIRHEASHLDVFWCGHDHHPVEAMLRTGLKKKGEFHDTQVDSLLLEFSQSSLHRGNQGRMHDGLKATPQLLIAKDNFPQ